jgi:hypothetical protein
MPPRRRWLGDINRNLLVMCYSYMKRIYVVQNLGQQRDRGGSFGSVNAWNILNS